MTKEEKVAYTREWRQRNPERVKLHNKAAYDKNKETILIQQKAYVERNKDKTDEYKSAWSKENYYSVKTEVLEALGDKCSRCGIDDRRVLCIDHIDGGGYKELRSMSAVKYLHHVLENLEKYQILCHNCNWIKRFENGEVRKRKAVLL